MHGEHAGPRVTEARARRAEVLALVPAFDTEVFAAPEAFHWPGYFWLWNDALDPEVIREQLRDMAAHGARSVVMLPMPHAFRPETTNSFLWPDYLTPEFFARVRDAVAEAARLDMHWWLYDEGGWPSGQAAGEVLEGHPEFGDHKLTRQRVPADGPYTVPAEAVALIVETPRRQVFRAGMTWKPASRQAVAFVYRVETDGRSDLLNPQVTRRFIELTHARYRAAIGEHFGHTVRFAFTDEPAVNGPQPPGWITWTPGMEALYAERFGREIWDDLPSLFATPQAHETDGGARARVDFFDLWTGRFREAYFAPLRQWCRRHRLASGGHLGGEDETLGAVRHGFGHALRQLRAMDVPGVDVIWRQLFPGRQGQHHFPKFAASAAHQNGTRFAFTESYAVYGNGLTPAQMKWLVDYQFVRGINLLVGACYPLSTREHHMMGERPHFGRCNPLWDHLHRFHGYAARLGYCLAVGEPEISVALYYPARDLWAWGEGAPAAALHDELAAALLSHQVDFDLIDDEALAAARVEHGRLAVGAMRYGTVVCGAVHWMRPEALLRLRDLAAGGGAVWCARHTPGMAGEAGSEVEPFGVCRTVAELAGRIAPSVSLTPPGGEIRVSARRTTGGRILMLFNEGMTAYAGHIPFSSPRVYRLEPATGKIEEVETEGRSVSVDLLPGESALLLFSDLVPAASTPLATTAQTLELDGDLVAVPRRRFAVGTDDFEIAAAGEPEVPFCDGGKWSAWLGQDFSGEVDYRASFQIPDAWGGDPLRLETGQVEYAATVLLDGGAVGQLSWPPWRLDLPPCAAGRHELVIRVANTLANELTSARVVDAWSTRVGPGWPGPYHHRALEFEGDTQGGGLRGPVVLRRMKGS